MTNLNKTTFIFATVRIQLFQFFHDKIYADWRMNGGCQHVCLDTGICACRPGYQLDDDGIHCYPTPPPPTLLPEPTVESGSPCGHVRVDVVFVIDSSNSIGHKDFARALMFVVNFIEFFRAVNNIVNCE